MESIKPPPPSSASKSIKHCKPTLVVNNGGVRKISVGRPEQIFFRKYIKWEGRNKFFSENTHEIAKKYINGLRPRGGGTLPGPLIAPPLVVNATSYPSQDANSSGVTGRESNVKSLGDTLYATYKFLRPYSLIGVALSIISLSLLAVKNLSDLTPSLLLRVLQATLGGCLVNLYTTGVNQLSDIEIDKVNKPYLPLASGEFSVKTGVLLTSLFAIMSFCIGWSIQSPPLRLGLFLWFLYGTAYSVNLPLLRWKRAPVVTTLAVSTGFGLIPILFYLDAQTYINNGGPLQLSKHIIFVSVFMSIFSIALALFKDIPDVEGDKNDGVNSFAIQFGEKRVFWISIWLLEMAYGMAILIGLLSTGQFWIRSIMVTSHSILGYMVWKHAYLVDIKSPKATGSFYLFMWKLYYVEYLLVPILRF